MNQPEEADHWDLLAQQLGARIEHSEAGEASPHESAEPDSSEPAEACETEAGAAPAESSAGGSESGHVPDGGATLPVAPVPLRRSRPRSKPVRRPRSAADWSKLAADLGIEVPVDSAPERAASGEDSVTDEQRPAEPAAEGACGASEQADQAAPSPGESGPREASSTGSTALVPAESAAEMFGPLPGFAPPSAEEVPSGRDSSQDEAFPTDTSGRHETSGGDGFPGAGDEESTSESARPQWPTDWPERPDEEMAADLGAEETTPPEEAETDKPAESKRSSARRGKKRRRKGRKRPSADTATEEAAADQIAPGGTAEPTSQTAHGDQQEDLVASPDGAETVTAGAAGESANEQADDKPPEAEGSKKRHRAIPTWEEVVGVVVAANLEARGKGSGGGSGRKR